MTTCFTQISQITQILFLKLGFLERGFQDKDFRNKDFRTRISETRISGFKDLEDFNRSEMNRIGWI